MEKINVKAGDKVLVVTRHNKYVEVVKKITPSGLIKVGNSLYYDTGKMRGGDIWDTTHIRETNDEEIEEIKREGEARKVKLQMKDFNGVLFYEDAMEIKNILDRYKRER